MTGRAFLILAGLTVILLVSRPDEVETANILGFFPTPSKSHLIIHCAIADALVAAGHNVTVLSTMPNVNKRAKYRYINTETGAFSSSFIAEMVNNPQPIYKKLGSVMSTINKVANETLAHPKVQRLMREEKDSYDLIILGYFMNEFHFGLAAHFNCPVILSFMVRPVYTINSYLGNPAEVSYVPTLLSGLQQPMGFMQRVKNFVLSAVEEDFFGVMLRWNSEKYYRTYFPSPEYPPLEVLQKNISLVFTNHHFSQGPIRPNVPALVEIGGIQIKEQPDPLPKDIAEVLDSSPEGVIYFSMGSNVQGQTLSPEKAAIMFQTLSKLPYKVLWKWGDTATPGTSSNIVYKSWLPQDDILAHRNVKLFITHGGQGSIVESQYHGVPMVGIPLFGDQHANMVNVEEAGFGLQLDYLTLSEERFKSTILEVITQPKYAAAVKKFSTLYRDRPLTPRQLVVYWVDYVLRHRGALHLQSPAVHMSSWQLRSLDVIAFLLAVSLVVIFVLVKVCKLICCRTRKAPKLADRRERSKTKKNN